MLAQFQTEHFAVGSLSYGLFSLYIVHMLNVSGTGFLGCGGHATGQRVGVDPSLAALLGARARVYVAPEVGSVHHRQTVQGRVLIICSHINRFSTAEIQAHPNCNFTLSYVRDIIQSHCHHVYTEKNINSMIDDEGVSEARDELHQLVLCCCDGHAGKSSGIYMSVEVALNH